MISVDLEKPRYEIKKPENLSPRIKWLREYYFQGVNRAWNNEYTSWSTGTPWDFQYNELAFYIVPETYTFLQTFRSSFNQVARPVTLSLDFWELSLPERRAWFNKEVMVHYLPREILPGDLLAGARFNIQTSACMTKKETRERDNLVYGPKGARSATLWFHNHGYGNAGATSGHLIPDYGRIIREGWKAVYSEIEAALLGLPESERNGKKGGELRAMMTAATMPRDLAAEYARECDRLAQSEGDSGRRSELHQMAEMLTRIPWEPPQNFWEAVEIPLDQSHVNYGGRKLPWTGGIVWSS